MPVIYPSLYSSTHLCFSISGLLFPRKPTCAPLHHHMNAEISTTRRPQWAGASALYYIFYCLIRQRKPSCQSSSNECQRGVLEGVRPRVWLLGSHYWNDLLQWDASSKGDISLKESYHLEMHINIFPYKMIRLKVIGGGKAERKEWVDRDGTGMAKHSLGLIYEHVVERLILFATFMYI